MTGLPKQAQRVAYYELWLTKGHKPVEPCGAFRVNGDKDDRALHDPVRPRDERADGWVVTAQPNGRVAPGPRRPLDVGKRLWPRRRLSLA